MSDSEHTLTILSFSLVEYKFERAKHAKNSSLELNKKNGAVPEGRAPASNGVRHPRDSAHRGVVARTDRLDRGRSPNE